MVQPARGSDQRARDMPPFNIRGMLSVVGRPSLSGD
jgi:hypothetical protein